MITKEAAYQKISVLVERFNEQFADDFGIGDVGCYGADNYKTPNIDKLASQGQSETSENSHRKMKTHGSEE